MKTKFTILLLLASAVLHAQADSLTGYIYSRVTLDEVVVTASKSELDLWDFITLVQEDRSFYRAFYNLRTRPYVSETRMTFYNRQGRKKAGRYLKTSQWSDGQCYHTQTLEEKTEGKFYTRKGAHRYYTSELYDHIFFAPDTICTSPGDWQPRDTRKLSGRDKQIEELKKLLFATGQPANIPLIGDKAAIFTRKMIERYEYEISSDTLEGRPCYLFSVHAKPDLAASKTVIKRFDIWFERGSLQVLRRKFFLYQRSALYDFDVKFDIRLEQMGDLYLPQSILYQGWWKVPFQKLEKARAEVLFSYF